MDIDYHKILNEHNEIININKDIIIGNNLWILCRCILLKSKKMKIMLLLVLRVLFIESLKKRTAYMGVICIDT